MDKEIVGYAVDIATAQAGVRTMSEDEISNMVSAIATELEKILSGENGDLDDAGKHQEPAVDPKKSIRKNAVYCIECGKKCRLLSKKHLATHGLTPEQYKAKWGLKGNTSLIARGLAEQRRQKMHEVRPWKKTEKAK